MNGELKPVERCHPVRTPGKHLWPGDPFEWKGSSYTGSSGRHHSWLKDDVIRGIRNELYTLSQPYMRAAIQRVLRAQVSVGDEVTGSIGPGLLVLLGVAKADTHADADYLAAKILSLRIFDDNQGKMNLSLIETRGSVLAVSQFTLYGDVRRGRRPSFEEAAPPALTEALYEHFVKKVRESGFVCETGRFQATMQVELVNDGPVTILLDSTRAF